MSLRKHNMSAQKKPERQFYDTWCLARMLKTSRAVIQRWCREGIIPAEKDRGRWYVRREDLREVYRVARHSPQSGLSDLCEVCGEKLGLSESGPNCGDCDKELDLLNQ